MSLPDGRGEGSGSRDESERRRRRGEDSYDDADSRLEAAVVEAKSGRAGLEAMSSRLRSWAERPLRRQPQPVCSEAASSAAQLTAGEAAAELARAG
jgi:hypothetical protein